MLYDIEEKYKNTDWDTEGINQLSTLKQNAQTLYQEALKLGRIDLAQGFLNDINNYDLMLADPKSYAEQIKSTVYNSELQNRIDLDMRNSNFNSVEKANEYQLKAQELQKQKEFELYKRQLDAGLIEGIPAKNEESKTSEEVYKAAIASGKGIYRDGKLIPVSELATEGSASYNPQESRDNKVSAGTPKQQKITLNKKPVDKQTVINDVTTGNISVIEQILKEFPDRFDTKDGIDPNTLKIENGKVVWQDDDYFYDDKRSVDLKDIVDFIKAEGENSTSESNTGKTYRGLDANGDPIFN